MSDDLRPVRPAAPTSPVHDIVQLPRTIVTFVVEGLRWMIAEPVNEGRIRFRGRSWGFRAFALAAIGAAVLGTAIPILGSRIRERTDLAVVVIDDGVGSFPRAWLWLPVAMLVLSTSLMVTAALHSAIWLRVSLFVVNALMLLFVGTSDVIEGMSTGMWTAVVCVVAMAALHVWRWRARPAWWEGVIALALVTTVYGVAYRQSAAQSVEYGIDRLPPLTETILRVSQFVPYVMLLVAGAAVAKVALSGVALVAEFGSRRFSPTTFLVAVLLVVLARLVTSVIRWVEDLGNSLVDTLDQFAGAGLMFVGVAVVWWVLDRRMRRTDAATVAAVAEQARRERERDRELYGDVQGDEWWEDDAGELRQSSTVEDVIDQLDSVAFPVAIALSLQVFPLMIGIFVQGVSFAIWRDNPLTNGAQSLVDFVNDPTTQLVLRVVGAVVLIGGGWWSATKGRRGAAELMAATGVVVLLREVMADGAWLSRFTPSPVAMDRIGVVLACGAVVWWLAKRRLTPERQAAVLLLVLMSSLLNHRDFISSPITSLIGSASLGAAMFGLMWNLFTEAGHTNGDSPKYPRDSRLMLFLSQILFGVVLTLWVVMSRDLTSSYAFSTATQLGDAALGVTLLLVALVTTLRNASASGNESSHR